MDISAIQRCVDDSKTPQVSVAYGSDVKRGHRSLKVREHTDAGNTGNTLNYCTGA